MLELIAWRTAFVAAARPYRSIRLLVPAALLAFGTQSAAAALDGWTPLGPDGGTTFALVVEPQSGSVYVGTKAGVFGSTDGGAHWASANGNLPVSGTARGIWVMALAVDAGSPAALYASVLLHGIFKSLDGGQTWQHADSGLIGYTEILVADPSVPGTAYAATSGGLFKTTDAGGVWTKLPGIRGATALAVDPNASGTVYGWLSGEGLSKSVNGGQTWTRIGADVLGVRYIDAVAVDPRSSNRVFASAVDFGTGKAGLFRSLDGGSTWAAAGSGLPLDKRITSLAMPRGVTDVVYAGGVGGGVFKSVDLGAHWGVSNGALDFVRALAIDSTQSGGLYAIGSSSAATGVFKTVDEGASWSFRSTGIAAFELRDLVIDPKASSTLYALSLTDGVLKSVDGGTSWQTANQGLPASSNRVVLDTLTIDPVDPRILYASAVGVGPFKTLDGGQHWASIARPGHDEILDLDVDPVDSRILVAGTSEGLFRSTDGGSGWVRTSEGFNFFGGVELVRDPASPAAIYAAGVQVILGSPDRPEGFLLKSVDHGSSWNVVSEGFFSFLQIDPRTPSTLYASTGSEIVRSTDGGAHWFVLARAPGSAGFLQALLVDPLDPSTFVVDNGDDLLRSDDEGRTWRSWSDGLGNRDVTALVVDPISPERLYVATRGGGLSARFLSELAPCTPGPTRLCFQGGRFQAEVSWEDFDGNVGEGKSRELGGDSGAFWFFHPDNVELTVKVLDGRGLNDKFWVFYGSLTNVEFTLTVTDTATGRVRSYHNPKGAFASAGDTTAF